MTRTLVIQLGRLGDIIQTTPLLSELAASGDHVDVLTLRPQHEVLLGFPAVANIITIPESLKPLDDAIACGFPDGKIPAEAHELLAALRLPLYDRIINASHAPLGAWLAGAIPCANPNAHYGGIIRDRECLYLGAGSAYRIAMLQFREQNLFNLVDLIRAAPGIALYANQSAELPFALPPGRKVALNPGASEAARCWPAESFARLAEALSAADFVPLLVGAPCDVELCEKIKSSTRADIQNFAGRTTIPEMAALLARCDLLVSADTGAAHLSAAVGTTVLGLFGATAWFAETAPYGDNHLILQTPLNAPMSAISPDAVFASALNRLGRLSITDLRAELQNQNQSAWETSVQPPSQSGDPLGGLCSRPVHRGSLTSEELFSKSLRHSFATEFTATISTSRSIGDKRPLEEVLHEMHTVANLCADSIGNPETSCETSAGASALIATMENLRAVAAEPQWHRFSPIIHNLEWQLRMLPPRSPERTFRAHAQAYVSAARILRLAKNNRTHKETHSESIQSEKFDWKGITSKGRKEGGQVPHSVRSQAPARQRGSVSP